MKDAIHPNYDTCTVKCACGATFETKSTKGDMKVDICSKSIRSIPANRSWLTPAAV